jgi:hypothetical protein
MKSVTNPPETAGFGETATATVRSAPVPPGVTVTTVVVVGLVVAEGEGIAVTLGLGEGDGVPFGPPAVTVLVGLVRSVHTARISVSAEKIRNGTYNLHSGPTSDHTRSYVMNLPKIKVSSEKMT